ncbi:MAG: hypothetical protein ACK5OB_20735 [Pirellula sp.]
MATPIIIETEKMLAHRSASGAKIAMQRAIIMEVPNNEEQSGEEAIVGTETQGLVPRSSRVRSKLLFRGQRF